MILYRSKELQETPWTKCFAWFPTYICVDEDRRIYEIRWLETIEKKIDIETDSVGGQYTVTLFRLAK